MSDQGSLVPDWTERWSGESDEDQRPLLAALHRRRALRAGLVQAIYVAGGAALGTVLPRLAAGPTADAGPVQSMLIGMAGGLISFIALVFSLLFLVVQYGNTTVSPRLTLFRDDPLVWHCFGFFAAVLVYCSTASFVIGSEGPTISLFVPVVAIVLVLVALGLSRTLQMRALKLLQFNSTMEEIRRRGEEVLDRYYTAPVDAEPRRTVELPEERQELRWNGASTLLQQVDLPGLLDLARRNDAVIELRVRIGDELRRGAVVGVVRCDREVSIDPREVVDAFATGIDRVFVQDPLLAFRLLTDIGNRALSLAINDPATAVQAIATLQDLLAVVATRRVEFGPVRDADGHPRVQLCTPSWEAFVAATVDELLHYASAAPSVRVRLLELLDDVEALTPPHRHRVLADRRALLTAAQHAA